MQKGVQACTPSPVTDLGVAVLLRWVLLSVLGENDSVQLSSVCSALRQVLSSPSLSGTKLWRLRKLLSAL